ncbi:DUF3995 domain-containing protein [Bacillus infantis]|uniref:DUF3995 domain-containing protein n=2 Tax=Bacillus infantis TaxID=324767 RepID=UPI00301719E4
MVNAIISITSLILISMGILHVFWAFGGKWGVTLVLPTKDDGQLPVLQPRMAGTLFIGLLCFFASVLLLVQSDLLTIIKSSTLSKWLCIAGGTVFLLRAIEKGQGDRPLGSKKPRDLSPWFKNIL